MTGNDALLDVLVRFHDMQRYQELDRCVFSLVTQSYRPVRINVITQRFTPADTEALRASLDPLMKLNAGAALNLVNFADNEPQDARSRLLNIGLQGAKGRFVSILDYDDTIYPESYGRLIKRLRGSAAAIAFGRIVVKYHEVFDDALIVTSKEHKFVGRGLIELFEDNFCPIHSFVIDRMKAPPQLLYFSELLSRLEDYDFLLRLTAKCRSDFALVDTPIGDYFYKNDGSNTVQISDTDTGKNAEDWSTAREYIGVIRETTKISPDVQRQLGLATPIAGLTISQVLRARAKWATVSKGA
jgi:hypothetical protein